MEGGGGGARHAAQGHGEEKEKGGVERQPRGDAEGPGGGGGMRFRVSARAPHGVGALLLIGGAVLAGAAVVAWRRARRGKRDRQPAAKQEGSGGGVAEGGQGDARAPEIDGSADGLTRDKEITEIGTITLDDARATQEIQKVHDDPDVVANEPNSERVQKLGLDSRSSPADISNHGDTDSEPEEKADQGSTRKLPDVTAHDLVNITAEKGMADAENDHNSTRNENEKENSSKNDDLMKDVAPNDTAEVEASDQRSHGISPPAIVLDEQSLHSDSAQAAAESMENSPTAQLMMHQEQLLDEMTMDIEGDTAESKPGKGAALDDDDVHEQGQQKATAGLAGSPLVNRPAEKKGAEHRGRVETGMKIEQDYTNGGMKEPCMIRKGGAVVTVDRRSSYTAVLALMFALTVGIAIAVRFYAPLRATKLQMDLQ